MNLLENKVCIITGGGRGIGRATAETFIDAGATVIIADFDDKTGTATADDLGDQCSFVITDVSNTDSVQELVQSVKEQHGRIDVLINNAGITRDGLIARIKDGEIRKMSLANWQMVLDVNLTGTFLCGREFFVKLLEQKKSGVCINISSISRSGNQGQSNYTASKAAVAEMTVTWAKEMARHGIRVGAIAPGYINTEMVAAIREDVKQKIIEQIPIRRLGDPSEISHSVFYILENDYFTGRVIECDGGLRV